MSATIIFFAVVLAIRVVLDLTGLVKPGWRLEGAYCVLFAAAAIMLLIADPHELFAYACMLLALGWGVRAFIMFKRKAKEPNAEH